MRLCNAHHVKNVPGRKTDMSDAVWLADVMAPGPPPRPTAVGPHAETGPELHGDAFESAHGIVEAAALTSR